MLVAFQLTGCGFFKTSTKASPTQQIVLQDLPPEARSCKGPAEIVIVPGETVASPEYLFKGWGRDRKRLGVCKRVNDSLLVYIDTLQSGFNPK